MRRAHLELLLIALTLAATALPALGQEEGAPPPPAGAPTATAPAEKAEEPAEPRVSFDVRLGEDQGGGRVRGTAGAFEYEEERYLIATGGVELKYEDITVTAERARLDIPANYLTAEGEVVFDEGPQRLTGDSLELDLDARTGKLTQATAFVDPDYYFSGAAISKIGDATYLIEDGTFTSCSQEVPSWSIRLSRARVTLEEYAHIRNARLRFKRLPVLYFPYVLWPATTDRASGFLVPKPGYSQRRGARLDLAYYQTLGRSADTTFFLDLSSEEFIGFGNEVRYRPSETTEGYFRAYGISEPNDFEDPFPEVFGPHDDIRWKVEYLHESEQLWGQFRGVVWFEDYSDFDYLQDYERNVDRQTKSFLYSNAYLTRNVGRHSLNVLVDQRERIAGENNRDLRRQLPEIEYRLRSTQIGETPIYVSFDSGLHYFSVERMDLDDTYGRAYFNPTVSIPVSSLTWLSAKLNLGGTATYYTETVAIDESGQRSFSGDSLSRVIPEASFEVIGPVFSRIFDSHLGRFTKLKHLIEPRITYGYLEDFEEQNQIFNFDEVDRLNPVNGVTYSLTNRLLGKSEDEEDGGAFELASLELRQSYSLDDMFPGQQQGLLKTKEGPLILSLRVNPSRDTSLKTDFRYNTLFSQLQSFGFSGELHFGASSRIGLTWFTDWRVGQDVTDPMDSMADDRRTSDQMRLFTRFPLFTDKLYLDAEVSYDLLDSEILQQRYFLSWQAQCYSWQLEVRKYNYGVPQDVADERDEFDVRFSLTLKNVGTFLDINDSF